MITSRINSYQMIEIINSITYKPNCSIKAFKGLMEDSEFGLIEIDISLEVSNLSSSGTTRIGRREFMDPKDFDERDAIKHILMILHQMEAHETIEWFRYRGLRVNDPHPERNDNERLAFGEPLDTLGVFR